MSASQAGASRQVIRVGACLSLTGRFARFGTQAARGLEAWRSLDGAAELVIADDESSPRALESALPAIARQCDVLLGPYSTQLMRAAGRMAADAGWLAWNHGGSGDDAEAAHPGHIVSVLTPASRYAEPFLRYLAGSQPEAGLWITHGKGSFGRQVAVGAAGAARRLGIEATLADAGSLPEQGRAPDGWGLLCAGTFEDDVETVRRAQALASPPATMCAVAAGVREFGEAIADAEGIFGVGQWFPGTSETPELGPSEPGFLAACAALSPAVPDYPAVQAAAAAVLAAHCARLAGGTRRELLWEAALSLGTRTLFGDFKINADGVQVGHDAVLVRWAAGSPVAA
jgi:ABC-type branched-subunit amino acid transport system substrate-binding protein